MSVRMSFGLIACRIISGACLPPILVTLSGRDYLALSALIVAFCASVATAHWLDYTTELKREDVR